MDEYEFDLCVRWLKYQRVKKLNAIGLSDCVDCSEFWEIWDFWRNPIEIHLSKEGSKRFLEIIGEGIDS